MEFFEIYDAAGRRLGLRPRAECHGDPRLIHRAAHVVIFNPRGDLLLQKRAQSKDVQPGKWDTAVGGHLVPGESWEQAARREMEEELGVLPQGPLEFLFFSQIRNAVESEDAGVYTTVHAGPFHPLAAEIDELRFWTGAEARAAVGTGVFTPNLDAEVLRLSALGRLVMC